MIPVEHRNFCKTKFSTHKATLIQDTDRYCIIDWRRADGSGDYYVNYIVDKKRGSLVVSGDVGDSIATWYNPIKVSSLKGFLNDIDYYISKMQCASDKYRFDDDDILKDIKGHFREWQIEIDAELYNYDSEEEFWEDIESEIADSGIGYEFQPTERLRDIISEYDDCYYEWLFDCGRRIDMRVYLWAVGFQMACEQLGI